MSVITWVKEHPYETAGGVFVVGIVAIVVLNFGGGSSSSNATTATDPNAAAEIAAEQAAEQQSAQLQGENTQDELQLQEAGLSANVATTQVNDNLTATQSTNQTAEDINAENVAGSVQNTQTTSNASVAETVAVADAQLGTAEAADTASIDIAGVNATTQQLISQYSNQALEVESTNLAQASETQANATASVGKAIAGEQETTGIVSAIAGIF